MWYLDILHVRERAVWHAWVEFWYVCQDVIVMAESWSEESGLALEGQGYRDGRGRRRCIARQDLGRGGDNGEERYWMYDGRWLG